MVGFGGRASNLLFPVVFVSILGLQAYGDWLLSTSVALLVANITDVRVLIWGAKKNHRELLCVEVFSSAIGLLILLIFVVFTDLATDILICSYLFAIYARVFTWLSLFQRSRYLTRISQGFLPGLAGVSGMLFILLAESSTYLVYARFLVPLVLITPFTFRYVPMLGIDLKIFIKSMKIFDKILFFRVYKQVFGNALINQLDKVVIGFVFPSAALGVYGLLTGAHAGLNMINSYWINIVVVDGNKTLYFKVLGFVFLSTLIIFQFQFQFQLHLFFESWFDQWSDISPYFNYLLLSNLIAQLSFFSRLNFLKGTGLYVSNTVFFTGIGFFVTLILISILKLPIEVAMLCFLLSHLIVAGKNILVYLQNK